jgi:hypothetical protein
VISFLRLSELFSARKKSHFQIPLDDILTGTFFQLPDGLVQLVVDAFTFVFAQVKLHLEILHFRLETVPFDLDFFDPLLQLNPFFFASRLALLQPGPVLVQFLLELVYVGAVLLEASVRLPFQPF